MGAKPLSPASIPASLAWKMYWSGLHFPACQVLTPPWYLSGLPEEKHVDFRSVWALHCSVSPTMHSATR